MCGIERKCETCGKWLSPARFERMSLNALRKDCKTCRNIYKLARVRELRGDRVGQNQSTVVAGPVRMQAAAIAGAAGGGPIFAYRFHTGSVTWRRKAKGPEGAEFLGCYNPGCDYRQIVQDLQAA